MFEKFGFSGTSKVFIRCGEVLTNGLYVIFAAIGSVFLSFGNPFYGVNALTTNSTESHFLLETLKRNDYRLFYIGFVFFVLGSFGIYYDQSRQKNIILSLEKDKQKIDNYKIELNSLQEENQSYISKISEVHSEMVKLWLKEAHIDFNLQFKGRISLYFHYNNEFNILSRYSQNPEFSKIHRQKFPRNSGVIGLSWQYGQHLEDRCPAFCNDKDAYIEYMYNNYGYSKEKTLSINMKSCRYLGVAIVDAREHVGVILVETIDESYFKTVGKIDYIFDYISTNHSELSKFVRDAIAIDKEVVSKRSTRETSVEDELLLKLEGGIC